jgi:hypothetical protein
MKSMRLGKRFTNANLRMAKKKLSDIIIFKGKDNPSPAIRVLQETYEGILSAWSTHIPAQPGWAFLIRKYGENDVAEWFKVPIVAWAIGRWQTAEPIPANVTDEIDFANLPILFPDGSVLWYDKEWAATYEEFCRKTIVDGCFVDHVKEANQAAE